MNIIGNASLLNIFGLTHNINKGTNMVRKIATTKVVLRKTIHLGITFPTKSKILNKV